MSYLVIIKQGNLLEESNATFIVNASNTRLLLGSGVSMAFKRHCGYELQQEMSAKLESLGDVVQKGDVIATSSGRATNFKYALHAAIMDYNPGKRGNEKLPILTDISNVLKSIESYVRWYIEEKNNHKAKLVLPLMGCGVGGLDKHEVIKLYKSFFQRAIDFECEVVMYGYTQEDVQLIQSTFSLDL